MVYNLLKEDGDLTLDKYYPDNKTHYNFLFDKKGDMPIERFMRYES